MTFDLFNNLPPRVKTTKQLAKGSFLFRQDDPTFAIFFLKSGQIQLTRHTEKGDQLVIHHAYANETFAEASLFSDAYHCDAVALETTQVEIYSKPVILAEMQNNVAFSMAMSAHFARQIQTSRRRLEINAIRHASPRILMAMSEGLFENNIKSFAAKIGLTHEATYRGLAKLVQQGKLQKTARGKYKLI